ncbi:hypothetical protein [Salipaludibacillus daqingensis]|uniref:hypothetical protein n=1 Tax=Salipaludibacillus daqingensis TaxID=3041001 RepID=UPI0024768B13|nr:hypothetical protein [Salipaludibacillus daqingensis]
MGEFTTFELTEMDPTSGEVTLHIKMEGETNLPVWKHDLKLDAALALLETVDRHHFIECSRIHEFEEYMEELKDIIEMMRA